MQSIYLPQSLSDELPEYTVDGKRIDGKAKYVLLVLLSHSNASYKSVFCGIPRLCKLTGIKSETTIRKLIGQLEEVGCLAVNKRYEYTKRGKLICHNEYFFTFQPWIDKDVKAGKAGTADNVPAMVKRAAERAARQIVKEESARTNKRIDRIEFAQKTMSDLIAMQGVMIETLSADVQRIHVPETAERGTLKLVKETATKLCKADKKTREIYAGSNLVSVIAS